jgi:hypothetical protein
VLSRVWALLPLLLASPAGHASERVVVIFALADARATVAPCGCTTDPLGGLDRLVTLVEQEKRPHLLVVAGPLEAPAEERQGAQAPEAAAKAKLLEHVLYDRLHAARAGTHQVGGVRIAVATPGAAERPARPPAVDLTVAAFDLARSEVRRIARAAPGIDLAVVGRQVGLGEPAPEVVGASTLVVPADQLQKVVRIEVHLRPGAPAPIAYAGGPGELDKLDGRIASLAEQLAAWQRDPQADRGFVAARQAELATLRRERVESAAHGGVSAPPTGSWLAAALIPVRQKLASDPQVRGELKALAHTIGEGNRARDCAKPRPTAVEPHYVGMASCGQGGCHPRAVAFWKQTVHAHAWRSLIDDGRAFSLECFRCHVTGAGEPERGGATPCRPEPLVDVQCEVCHGPASTHVAQDGTEEPPSLHKRPPDGFCAERCHTPEHSDTFRLDAYLRDIVGEGHAGKRRAQLGPGPTGHELRQAGLRRAGRVP